MSRLDHIVVVASSTPCSGKLIVCGDLSVCLSTLGDGDSGENAQERHNELSVDLNLPKEGQVDGSQHRG